MRVPFHPRGAELPQRADGKGLEQVFAQAEDFQHRTLKLLEGGEVELYWVYGMVRNERLNDYVIRPLTTLPLGRDPAKAITMGGVWTVVAQPPKDLEEAAVALAEGNCALQVGRTLLLIPVPTEEKRAVTPPEDEPAQKGAKDAFVETLLTNTSLVRRHIHTWRLGTRSIVVGREGRIKVQILWIEGLTNPELVKQAARRVKQMDVDAVLDTQTLTDHLTAVSYTHLTLPTTSRV